MVTNAPSILFERQKLIDSVYIYLGLLTNHTVAYDHRLVAFLLAQCHVHRHTSIVGEYACCIAARHSTHPVGTAVEKLLR